MESGHLMVYVASSGNRLKYIFRFILSNILGLKYTITTDPSEFKAYGGPKFSYANLPLESELFFQSRSLLSENGINEQNITVSEWDGLKIFFATGKNSALPFDPFAASFYMVSRYEEYLPYLRDVYDRFETKESLAAKGGFIRLPVADMYAYRIKEILQARFPSLNFSARKYSYISTIDVDNAFAYKEKGLMRGLGGLARCIYKFDMEELGERFRVFFGLAKDPYDTYQMQESIREKHKLNSIYFFLLADYGMNDKNVPYQSRKLQSLIKSLGDHSGIGIHPSFGSNTDRSKLKTEIGRLAHIINSEVTRSRQHFLKLNFPQTYRNLAEMDVTDDYTMGFAHEIGFRAGTCTSFNFYDLDLEVETKLRVHPFAVMDATLKYYMNVRPEHVLDTVKPVIDSIRKVDGTFISLWHNESMGKNRTWAGWDNVYEELVRAALPSN